jgi:hypothetical protein
MVSTIIAEAGMNGDWANMTGFDTTTSQAGDVTDYFKSKLNYAKQCVASDTTSAGCTGDVGGNFRFIMPNGVKITILNLGYGWYPNRYWSFRIKADAYSSYVGAWNVNPTQVDLFCNNQDVSRPTAGGTGEVAKPNQCIGWTSNQIISLGLILN